VPLRPPSSTASPCRAAAPAATDALTLACRARSQARGRARLHLDPVLEHVAGARAVQVERGRGRDVERRRRVGRGLDIHDDGVARRQRVRHARVQRPREALAAQQPGFPGRIAATVQA